MFSMMDERYFRNVILAIQLPCSVSWVLQLGLNLFVSLFLRNYSQSNINLTLHTINEPWLFSLLWCSGVSSVSSEASHVLNKVPYPVWIMVRNPTELPVPLVDPSAATSLAEVACKTFLLCALRRLCH